MNYLELLDAIYNTEYAHVVLALAMYDDVLTEEEAENIDIDLLYDKLMDNDYITTVLTEDIIDIVENLK